MAKKRKKEPIIIPNQINSFWNDTSKQNEEARLNKLRQYQLSKQIKK